MHQRPPAIPERLLGWVLGDDDSARAIRGDLSEDFAALARRVGLRRARSWYRREAVSVAWGVWVGRAFGGGPRAGRTNRTRGGTMGILQDIRYAFNAVRRDKGYALFATAMIGLGVGASTAVYSLMSPLLVRPLPFHEPHRLVLIENDVEGGGLSAVTSRTSNLRDFRDQARSFDALGGYNAFFEQESYNLVGTGAPERLVGVGVTSNFLDVLGVPMAAGRNFTQEEGLFDGPPAVILSHGFWVRRFGADPSVVGSTLTLDERPREVVGVLPPSFDFSAVFSPTTSVDLLLTWPVSDETDRWGNTTTIVGRLRTGVTIPAAQSELESIVAALEEADPQRWGLGAMTSDLQERIARPFRSGMLLLAAGAGLVMLIVCLNLSNMLLARSPRRRREMAVRRALGATRSRLVRQLLAESVIVSMCGAALGLAVAAAATGYVSGTQGLEIPLLSAVGLDASALLFTVTVALAAGLVVGVIPALQVAEGGEAEAMGGSARGSTSGRAGRRLREALVVSEVALACVLLVLGGLVLRSFQRVMDVELGFDAENAVVWLLSSHRSFETLAEVNVFYDQVVGEVEAVPGVRSAALIDALPLGRHRTWGARVVGVEYTPEDGLAPGFFPHIVDHRYLETMGIPLVAGRALRADDTRESDWVVMVNETAARHLFPEGEALGHRLGMWYGEAEVVGIVGDIQHQALDLAPAPEVYFPIGQVWDFSTLDLVVRSDLPAASVTTAVGAAIQRVDPTMPTEDFRSIESVVERSVSPRRLTMQLLGVFALAALVLAALGIYGVLSYSVTERLPEIGIRMALGESGEEVRRGVVLRTLGLATAGVVIGVIASLASTRMVGSLLYGVEPTDPATFGAMVILLLAIAFLSGLVPAIRASRTDSAGALRST